MDFLPIYDFATSHMGYLENIGSLTCVDFPNVDIFHYTTFKKIAFVSITLSSMEKSLITEKLSSF